VRNSPLAKVCVISLGCPKNLVDAEGACGEIAAAGHELVCDPASADVVLINTCAFIESARGESVETIEEMIATKHDARDRKIIVMGCLAQRYGVELIKAEPEIDGVLGIHHAGQVSGAIDTVLAGTRAVGAFESSLGWEEQSSRLCSTPPWTAYLKICDGCDNHCSYCAIPGIRGHFRSRPLKLILEEARHLADRGVKEIILVGQDITQYGSDLEDGATLVNLLERLSEIDSLQWIRLMYCYPTKITKELVELVAHHDKIVKYLDIPFQHGDDRILSAMNRRGSSAEYVRLVDELREQCPEITLRSSFITGFPGETEDAFRNLVGFIERIQLDRAGVFEYSREEGTAAYKMKPLVPGRIARKRREIVMELQQQISLHRNQLFLGKTLTVLVEQVTERGIIGRSYRDAPDIDGVVYVDGASAKPGDFVEVEVVQASDYDLIGVPAAAAVISS
jgi:ribosomal protein S12 methylthiotransferase